jgi:cyclopropane-fatty-acyl-phospholipid synthase
VTISSSSALAESGGIEGAARHVIEVTQDNLAHVTAELGKLVRQAFGYALQIHHGSLEVQLPDGQRFRFRGRDAGPHGIFVIHDLGFAARLMEGGDIGLAEAYIAGQWDSPDVTGFLELFCVNHQAVATLLPGRPVVKLIQRFRHWLNRNTKRGAKRNIHAHYDIGNAFYTRWLDDTMTYSSALYAPGDDDLGRAQARKYRHLAALAGIRPGDHVLEIGCGWGGFAEFAATELGCRVTGLTISAEQHAFATARMARAGVAGRTEIKLQDYRDETGLYDRIVSIEMFEAVGEAFWVSYFNQLRDRLKPGGTAGLQIITIDEKFWSSYSTEIDFIRRYIFPGGMLPTLGHLERLAAGAGLTPQATFGFGQDYARTLADWRLRFLAAWPELEPLGFDGRFRRLWSYYFHYCEAGFRSGNIDVKQLVYTRA